MRGAQSWCISRLVDMASKAKTKTPPRKQHPFLVGCSQQEAQLLKRGAQALDMGPITLLRESGLAAARDALGLGEGEFK